MASGEKPKSGEFWKAAGIVALLGAFAVWAA
jgi:hypothetical protein